MKKSKIMFLLVLILIACTGCSVEYNINITEQEIEEVIKVTDNITENRTKNDIMNHYHMWYPTFVNFIEEGESIEIEDFSEKVDGIKYHNKTITETQNGYNYTYNYTYPIDEYYDSYILASIFSEITVHKEYDKLVLRTSKENFLCNYEYFDKAKVNITIDPNIYTLNYTNSTNVKNNTYTWELNRDNCSNGEIVLTINKTTNGDNEIIGSNVTNQKKESILSKYLIYIFCGILIVIILLGKNIINRLKNKNNSID